MRERTIPANAVLHDLRVGLGHEGLASHKPDVVSFRYEGEVHFNIVHEIIGGTVLGKWVTRNVVLRSVRPIKRALPPKLETKDRKGEGLGVS